MALLYFAEKQVEALVFEVGVGGRLDATNVVRPEVSVITSISRDHTELLGETLPEIAGGKGRDNQGGGAGGGRTASAGGGRGDWRR